MDRRRIARGLFAAAGAALLCLALVTCSNPIDIVGSVTTTVKIANNKFLKISDSFPAKNQTAVPPSTPIWIELDRDLDTSSVNTTNIVIEPAATWSYSYNPTTRTLVVQPDGLSDSTPYTVTISPGLRGADGGEMQYGLSWSFTTGIGPTGTVRINANAPYTASSTVTLNFTYNSAVDDMRYSFTQSDITNNAATGIQNWTSKTASIGGVSFAGTDGTKTIYAQFRNIGTGALTNGTFPTSDTIVYDTTPPVISAVYINAGAASTTSSTVTLTWSASDAASGLGQMRFMNGGGAWSGWETYASSKSWTLNAVAGTRTVSVQFMDTVNNASVAGTDAIIYSYPTVTSATLNSTTLGTATVGWNAATADAGTGTNYYRVYRRDYPSGGTYTYLGQTTGTSLNVAVPQGQLYYFHVSIYNASAGEGTYSATSAVGYSSNIAVIYNTNSTLANSIKTILGTNWTGTYPVTGTMPTWSVTLIPQSLVSTTYAAGNVFYGWPVILTPDTTIYSNANMTRNVTAHGKGVIAMGSGGGQLLDTVSANFATWGYAGTAPTEIGWGASASFGATLYANTWFSGNSVWTSPLSSTSVPGTDQTQTQMAYTTLSRISVYRGPTPTNPTNGWLYAQQNGNAVYFPVVRQDRFLQWGFEGVLDRPYTGWLFLVNITSRMSATYFP
jgi:hypothetical protein